MGAASDLKLFCSANMPNADTGTSGGAIDTLRRPMLIQLTATTRIEASSSAAGDTTQTLTVTGTDESGNVVSETKTLTGTTSIVFNTLAEVRRVIKAELSATCAGIVTVRAESAGEIVGTIPVGERGFMAVHREANASLSIEEVFYYKVFAKNTHAVDTLSIAYINELADPFARMTFSLATATGDSGSVTNRKTAPGGLVFGNSELSVPGGDLIAGETIGIWLRFAHPAGEADLDGTVTLRVGGNF